METGQLEKTYSPLADYVLIKNPLKGKVEEIEKAHAQLPPAEREAFLRKHNRELFENIVILEVGPDVKNLQRGDIAISNPELLMRAFDIDDNEYVMARENCFFAKVI